MKWRFNVTLLLLFTALFAVVLRLFYWQVVDASELVSLGESQYNHVVTMFPKRGEILASDSYSLVTNAISYLIYVNPKDMTDKNNTAEVLSKVLKLDQNTVDKALSQDFYYVPLANHVDPGTQSQLAGLDLSGVGYEQQSLRFYPEATLAAQLLGFVAKDASGNDKGYFGLEGYYNSLLKGKEGQEVEVNDAYGKPILAATNQQVKAVNGATLKLNIDRAVQYLVEKRLQEGNKLYGAVSGLAIVMNPKTGAVIAMAATPSFDPNNYNNYPQQNYINPAISSLYEPGSTFKPIVMASALDANLVTPDTKCTICSGPVSIGGYDIHTWDNKYFPGTSMNDVIVHSDNTGMVFVQQKLGTKRMLNYLSKFGIGQATGIDLQGEVSSSLKLFNQWYPIDAATASFGQGIDVTPIELLDAISAIANNGKRMEPHVVSQIQQSDGKIINIPPKVLNTPISAKAAKTITQIMVNAVNNGESKWTRLPGYRIAGKTGTAQIPVAGHYDPSKTIASFVGFAPADNPKFTMLVVMNEPTSSIYGSETAAPIFFSVAKDLLTYYGIAPTEGQ